MAVQENDAQWRIRFDDLLIQQLVIIRMTANPEPNQTVSSLDGKRSIVKTNSDGTIFPDVLKVKGRMLGICLQDFKAAVGLMRPYLEATA